MPIYLYWARHISPIHSIGWCAVVERVVECLVSVVGYVVVDPLAGGLLWSVLWSVWCLL